MHCILQRIVRLGTIGLSRPRRKLHADDPPTTQTSLPRVQTQTAEAAIWRVSQLHPHRLLLGCNLGIIRHMSSRMRAESRESAPTPDMSYLSTTTSPKYHVCLAHLPSTFDSHIRMLHQKSSSPSHCILGTVKLWLYPPRGKGFCSRARAPCPLPQYRFVLLGL
jgi:hypothetical protein